MTKTELEWIEKQAVQNMEFHLKNIEALNKEAHTTLALLLVSISASFTYAIKWFQAGGLETWAYSMVGVCAYHVLIAVYVSRAVKPRDVEAPGNRPDNLLRQFKKLQEENAKADKSAWPQDWALNSISHGHLIDLQRRIESNHSREEQTATAVNRARVLFIVTPAFFVATTVVVFVGRSVLQSLGP